MKNGRTSIFLAALVFFACAKTSVPTAPVGESMDAAAIPEEKMKIKSETDPRIEALIADMSLVEKVGQMTQLSLGTVMVDGGTQKVIDEGKLADLVQRYQIGSFLSGGAKSIDHWKRLMETLYRVGTEHQKHGVPPIFGIDHIHGTNYIEGGTMFPQPLNLAATFNPALAKKVGAAGSIESGVFGPHWNFAPVLDLARTPLWPRFYETFGEDPHLIGRMGEAFIEGVEGTNVPVAATAKHFLGYSDPSAGFDRAPAEISDQKLYELFLPPFRAAVEAGVKTFMINSGEINGIPVHGDRRILTGLLREELGFRGVVVTDWMDIIRLHTAHRVAANEKEAVKMAIDAGIDMSMTPLSTDYCRYLKELVEEGQISVARIDESVRRILTLKKELGMLDEPQTPLETKLGLENVVALNRQVAQQSIVLLENKGVLPLTKKKQTLLLAGPNTNRRAPLCGGWSVTWMPEDDSGFPEDMETVFEALKAELPSSNVVLTGAASLKRKARKADAIVLVLGEEPYAEGFGDITSLDLPQGQIDLAEAALSTGKPVIAVLVEGRPRTLPSVYDRFDAVVFAGLPCLEGARAIAGVISGRVNPSGKLPFTYPFRQGHLLPYNHKHLEFSPMHVIKDERLRYSVADFGDGLSYTTFDYSEIQVSSDAVTKDTSIVAEVKVTNKGDRDGIETVLFFLRDEVASITRPVKALKHFDRALIKKGETKTFRFEIIPGTHLSFPGPDGVMRLEPGQFTLIVKDRTASFELR